MKRILSVFLSLFLLTAVLTGCPAREDPTGDPTEGAGTQEQTQASTQEATQEPTTAAPVIPDVTFRLDELPEIGEYVPDGKISYFFPDGPTDALIPRPDYGRLVPYYGAPVLLETDFPGALPGEASYYEAFLGFAATDGRIVTSPYLLEGTLRETVDLGDGVGWYLFGTIPKDGGDWVRERTVIALDGSWQFYREGYGYTIDLSPFGAPYLLDLDFDTRTCGMYDPATGKVVRDCSFFLRDMAQSYEPPKPVWADESVLLVTVRAVPGPDGSSVRYESDNDTVTAFDMQGRELYQLDNGFWGVRPLAGSILKHEIRNEGFRLVEAHGKKISDRVYLDAFYCEREDLIMCPRGDENDFAVDYFTPQGEQVYPAENCWTWQTWSALLTEYGDVNWNGCLFLSYGGNVVFRDLYGRPAELPVPAAKAYSVWNRSGYGLEQLIYLCASDGRHMLCAADGTVLTEIRKPASGEESNVDGQGSIWPDDGAAMVLTADGELYFYDLATGAETRVDTAALRDWDPGMEIRNLFLDRVGQVGVCCTVYGDDKLLDFTFSPTDGRVLPDKVRLSSETAGYLRVATGGVSCLYAPDGTLLYRARNGALA